MDMFNLEKKHLFGQEGILAPCGINLLNQNQIYSQEKTIEIYPIFNLPLNSDMDTVKSRFRELAKKMHPDTGGSHEEE